MRFLSLFSFFFSNTLAIDCGCLYQFTVTAVPNENRITAISGYVSFVRWTKRRDLIFCVFFFFKGNLIVRFVACCNVEAEFLRGKSNRPILPRTTRQENIYGE